MKGMSGTEKKREYKRACFDGPDVRLSYIDYGGEGPVLAALHGHMNESRFIDRLAQTIGGEYRVISLDQRGHGESGRPASFALDRYAADALAFLDYAAAQGPVYALGHSLGGLVACRAAALQPERFKALILEDIGPVVDSDMSFTLNWPRRTETKEELLAALKHLGPAFAYSIRHFEDGYGLPFRGEDMVASQKEINGDHWLDWLATSIPALVLRGTRSFVLSEALAREMAERRPHVTLKAFNAGHMISFDQPEAYAEAIVDFLRAHP